MLIDFYGENKLRELSDRVEFKEGVLVLDEKGLPINFVANNDGDYDLQGLQYIVDNPTFTIHPFQRFETTTKIVTLGAKRTLMGNVIVYKRVHFYPKDIDYITPFSEITRFTSREFSVLKSYYERLRQK